MFNTYIKSFEALQKEKKNKGVWYNNYFKIKVLMCAPKQDIEISWRLIFLKPLESEKRKENIQISKHIIFRPC